MRGRKPKEGALRPDQRKAVKELLPNENADVPPLPEPMDYIGKEAWPTPVCEWWSSVWLSAVANEYQPSDIHSLYIGAVHLAQSLDADVRPSDRLKSAQQWEAVLKSFGLTPMARENLRWSISQAEQAEHRTRDLRTKKQTTKPAPKPAGGVNADLIALYEAQGR